MSHGGGGASVMGVTGGGVLQCQRRRDRVMRTPLASHDAQRAGLPRRQRLDAGVAQTSGGEKVRRPGDGADRLSGELGAAARGADGEEKRRERGARSVARRLFMAARWCGRRGKRGRGSGVGATWRAGTGKREGGPGHDVG
jgi:hypothetical protein